MRQKYSGPLTPEGNRHRLSHMDVAPGSVCLTGVLDEDIVMAMDSLQGELWTFQGQSSGVRRPDPSGRPRPQTGMLIGKIDYANGIIEFGEKFTRYTWTSAYEHGKA